MRFASIIASITVPISSTTEEHFPHPHFEDHGYGLDSTFSSHSDIKQRPEFVGNSSPTRTNSFSQTTDTENVIYDDDSTHVASGTQASSTIRRSDSPLRMLGYLVRPHSDSWSDSSHSEGLFRSRSSSFDSIESRSSRGESIGDIFDDEDRKNSPVELCDIKAGLSGVSDGITHATHNVAERIEQAAGGATQTTANSRMSRWLHGAHERARISPIVAWFRRFHPEQDAQTVVNAAENGTEIAQAEAQEGTRTLRGLLQSLRDIEIDREGFATIPRAACERIVGFLRAVAGGGGRLASRAGELLGEFPEAMHQAGEFVSTNGPRVVEGIRVAGRCIGSSFRFIMTALACIASLAK